MKISWILRNVLISTLFMLLIGGPIAYGQERLAPDRVSIRDIAWAGSGCPAGSVASNVAPDNRAFTLAFDEYIAEAGPGIPLSQARKNCNIILDLRFPQGWSFTIFNVDYRGFALLERLVAGTLRSAYFFQGDFPSAALERHFHGPLEENYERRDTLGIASLVWSPCGEGRALNINTEVRVNNLRDRSRRGLMTVDTVTGEFIHKYGLMWRRCS